MSGFREFNSVPGPAYPLGILSKCFYELSINDKSSIKLSETFYYIYIYYKKLLLLLWGLVFAQLATIYPLETFHAHVWF